MCRLPEVESSNVVEVSLLRTVSPESPGLLRPILRVAVGVAALIVVTTAEVTCLNFISISRVRPDLVLVLLVYLATERGVAGSFGCASVGGLLQDVLGTGMLGVNVFSKTVVCIVFGYVGTRVVIQRRLARIALLFAATLLDMTLQYSLLAVVGLHYRVGFYVLYLMVPCAFYNSLVMPLAAFSIERYTSWADRWSPRQQM